jgi:hypothetical protein
MGFFFQITGPNGIPVVQEGLKGTSADFDQNAYTLNVGAIDAKTEKNNFKDYLMQLIHWIPKFLHS